MASYDMSKAFTKETDGEDDENLPEAAAPQTPGTKNYLTPEGHACLTAELHQLRRVERPKVVNVVAWAAGNGDRSENGDYLYAKKRLREVDRRVRYLIKSIEIAEVVGQSQQKNRDQVFFGATVTYLDGNDVERTVRIVGADEARHEHCEVRWVTPIARALHKALEGDIVKLRTPSGIEEIEVLEITYASAPSQNGAGRRAVAME
jgi:transcription elongation factor GreB